VNLRNTLIDDIYTYQHAIDLVDDRDIEQFYNEYKVLKDLNFYRLNQSVNDFLYPDGINSSQWPFSIISV